jgi:hypothetical protein
MVHQPSEQGPGHAVVQLRDGCHVPADSIRGEHNRPGVLEGATNRHEQPDGLALANGPMAQLHKKRNQLRPDHSSVQTRNNTKTRTALTNERGAA